MPNSWVQDKDIKLFRIFYELVQAGGFSQAQVNLNISQSSLSTSIAQLETRVGMQLCTRGHAGFSLTEGGVILFEEISALFGAMENFSTNLSTRKQEITGKLSLGILENSVTHPEQKIIHALSVFQETAPKVELHLYTAGALELENRVLDGRLHGAIGLFPHRIENLQYIGLFDEEHRLYCGAEHALATGKWQIEQLARHLYAGRDYVDEIEGLVPPQGFNPSATSRHMEGLLLLLLTQKYFGYLPDHTAKPWVDQQKLCQIDAPGTKRCATFMLTLRKNHPQPKALSMLVDLLTSDEN